MQTSQSGKNANHLVALERADGEGFVSAAHDYAEPNQSASEADRQSQDSQLQSPEPLSFAVRPAGLADLASLGRFEKVYPLLQPDAALSGYRVVGSALRSKRPRSELKPVLLLAESGGTIVAFADFWPMPPDRRWCLAALGAATGVYDPTEIWSETISAGIRHAGLHGVKRLYGRAPEQSNVEVSLRQSGFEPYANETIYVSDAPQANNAGLQIREQDRADTWAIHQLYNASVPREVLYAEAFTSHKWEISNSRVPRSERVTGWLAEESTGPVAYLRSASNGDTHALDIIYLPDRYSTAVALIESVLRRLRHERRISRVFFTVRGYAQEIGSVLMQMGFAPGLTQNLLVKYTAVPVRAKASETVIQHLEIGDRVPSRAPSVLSSKRARPYRPT